MKYKNFSMKKADTLDLSVADDPVVVEKIFSRILRNKGHFIITKFNSKNVSFHKFFDWSNFFLLHKIH